MSQEPIGCTLCGGNDHDADECKRFAEWMAVPERGKFIDWVWRIKQERDALLAAQSAPVVPEGYVLNIEVEKLLCAKLGIDWTPAGMSIVSLVDQLALAAAPAQGQQVEWRKTAVMLEQANAGLAQLNGKLRAELAALKAQQVGQEPVAYLVEGLGTVSLHYRKYPEWARGDNSLTVTPLYTTPQPAPAQDVAGLVELLREADQELKDWQDVWPDCHDKATSDIRGRIAIALSAHDKQSGGSV